MPNLESVYKNRVWTLEETEALFFHMTTENWRLTYTVQFLLLLQHPTNCKVFFIIIIINRITYWNNCSCRPCLSNLLVLVLIQDELSCLAWRINDQWITIESIQHNGILRTQLISRQTVCLPAKTVVSIWQILQQINTAYHLRVTFIYTVARHFVNQLEAQSLLLVFQSTHRPLKK